MDGVTPDGDVPPQALRRYIVTTPTGEATVTAMRFVVSAHGALHLRGHDAAELMTFAPRAWLSVRTSDAEVVVETPVPKPSRMPRAL